MSTTTLYYNINIKYSLNWIPIWIIVYIKIKYVLSNYHNLIYKYYEINSRICINKNITNGENEGSFTGVQWVVEWYCG